MKQCAVIFDFDDTLVCTNDIYDAARLHLYSLMRELGILFEEEWPTYLNNADIEYVSKRGRLSAECFPLAMRQTCKHFAERSGVAVDESILQQAENLGWQVFETEPLIMDGAQEVLQYLQGRTRLLLLTEGDESIQLPRLQRSSLLPYFDNFHIVQAKNTAAYQELIQQHQLNPNLSWMVGNSVRADVNPAHAAGLNVAFFNYSSWDYDSGTPEGNPAVINSLVDFLPLFEAMC